MTANLQWSNGRTSRSSCQIYFSALTPIFSRSPSAPPSLPRPISLSICPHYPKGGCGFYVCSFYRSQLAFTRPTILHSVLNCLVMCSHGNGHKSSARWETTHRPVPVHEYLRWSCE